MALMLAISRCNAAALRAQRFNSFYGFIGGIFIVYIGQYYIYTFFSQVDGHIFPNPRLPPVTNAIFVVFDMIYCL